MRYWNCYRCGRQIPFDGKIKVIDGQVYHPNCPAKRPTDLPEAKERQRSAYAQLCAVPNDTVDILSELHGRNEAQEEFNV